MGDEQGAAGEPEDGVVDDSATLGPLGGGAPGSSGPPPPAGTPTPGAASGAADAGEAAQVELDRQYAADMADLPSLARVEQRRFVGPVFTHHEEAAQRHTDREVAGLPADEAAMAARVVEGEEAAIVADEERAKSDESLTAARQPGSPLAAEAASVVGEIERDENDAMGAAIQARMDEAAAEEHRRHHDLASTQADESRAQQDLARASADLADADRALAKLEADLRGGEPPSGQA